MINMICLAIGSFEKKVGSKKSTKKLCFFVKMTNFLPTLKLSKFFLTLGIILLFFAAESGILGEEND